MKCVIAICTLMFIASVFCVTQEPQLPEVCTPLKRSEESTKNTRLCLNDNNLTHVTFDDDLCNFLRTAIACEEQSCCNQIKDDYNGKGGNGDLMREKCGDSIKINCKRYESAGNAHRPMAGPIFLTVICLCMTLILRLLE